MKTNQGAGHCSSNQLSNFQYPASVPNVPPPTASPEVVAPEYNNGGCKFSTIYHTEWHDGNVHASGFSTAWPPNFKVLGTASDRLGIDLDICSTTEEHGGPTFAAVTSRSYHPGGVNALFGDGSVKFVKSTINGMIWRSLATVAGGEVVSSDSY